MSQNEYKNSFDELIKGVHGYKRSAQYFDFLQFISKIKNYSAFNVALLYAQNPKITYVATEVDWNKRHNRKIKPDAQPLIILAPFHPILFVFDVSHTEGKTLPNRVYGAFWADGKVPNRALEKIFNYLKSIKCMIDFNEFIDNQAGSIARLQENNKVNKLILNINKNHTSEVQFATIVHELAHLLCGHLGKYDNEPWDSRNNLAIEQEEFEAESISYIVCKRFGIYSNSAEYLSGYTSSNEYIPRISLDKVLRVCAQVENIIKEEKPINENIAFTPPQIEQLSLF